VNTLILIGYFSILSVLAVYGLHRWHITRTYKKHARDVIMPLQRFTVVPKVTIQLPVFNERFVVERLIDACAQIDYPSDNLQIQVLDDSTDDTVDLVAKRVTWWQDQGIDIVHIHRTDRSGFKAGALEAGLASASGEFVAIFDADFVPPSTILRDTIHFFTDSGIGMVQARWEHLNRETDTLTQVQAILLDAHFIIEHGGRCNSGKFFNFNGTAGIWRKICIHEAGGWQHDTLTEDLDLSYRAQLAGWRFQFLPDVTCPAELPAGTSAFKSQQHRWAKGSIQVMLKILPKLWASNLPLKVKMEASFHLTGNIAYLLMIVNAMFFVIPAMVVRQDLDWRLVMFVDGPLFLFLSGTFIYFYMTAQKVVFKDLAGRGRYIPALMAIGLGLSVNNTRAVIEALLGHQSPFVRTPKDGGQASATSQDYRLPINVWSFLEIGLGLFYTGAIFWAISSGTWASIPFLVLFQNGFLFMGLKTLLEARRGPKGPSQGLGGSDVAIHMNT